MRDRRRQYVARRRRARPQLRLSRQRVALGGRIPVADRGRSDRTFHERVLSRVSPVAKRRRSTACRADANSRERTHRGLVEFRGSGQRISVRLGGISGINGCKTEEWHMFLRLTTGIKGYGMRGLAAALLLMGATFAVAQEAQPDNVLDGWLGKEFTVQS